MRLGQGGYAGAGIYFADSYAATKHKATRKGVIFCAGVSLGRCLDINVPHNYNYSSLKNVGSDSVRVVSPK